MSQADEHDRAADLLERLLTDEAFRRAFRSDPGGTCRAYGLDDLAGDLGGGKALHTLEVRESRSSLAGVLMAAAAEGVGIGELIHHLQQPGAAHLSTPARLVVTRTLSRPSLHAVADPAAQPPQPQPQPQPAAPHHPHPVEHEQPAPPPQPPRPHPPHAAGGTRSLAAAAPVAENGGALPDPSDAYPGDDAPKEQIAAWMARQAHKAGLPGELPVMAALVESGLKNDDYGDRDSLGFFQMRTSVWDKGGYAGYAQHPDLQLKWFIDQAIAVKRARLADGDTAFLHDSSKWGDWIADVEQPAEQYRGRYQLQLDDARGLLVQTTPQPQPDAQAAVDVGAAATPPDASQAAPAALEALTIARTYLGTPYQWGGETPQTGFDCSGLAYYAYAQVGVHLPRVAADQFDTGQSVSLHDLEPGDLVFFKDSTGYVHHEGIYVGNGNFLHAPHTGDVVKISSLSEPYYAQQFAGGRREIPLVDNAPAAAAPPPPSAAAPPDPAVRVTGGLPVPDPNAAAPATPAAGPGRSTLQVMPVLKTVPETSGSAQDAAAAALSGAPSAYPGDDAPKEQVALWMAGEARRAGLPPELPVMAALTESNLTNVRYGDADSLGFFQMRASVWNRGEYAGYVDQPELQLKWFIREAVILREKRIADGDAGYGQDPSSWGDWVADIERPAAQFRGRYQEHLDAARALLGGGGAT